MARRRRRWRLMGRLPDSVRLRARRGSKGLTIGGFAAWRKVREMELRQEAELRQKEMDHQQKMKEMDLEMARLKDGRA